jgi:hypothetical protein
MKPLDFSIPKKGMTTSTIQNSYDRLAGGGGFDSSLRGLERASGRLADAASARDKSEYQSKINTDTKASIEQQIRDLEMSPNTMENIQSINKLRTQLRGIT